jgi:hypothetical protein
MNKQITNKNYYQTNQERIKDLRKARYQAQKLSSVQPEKQSSSRYYQANSIKVLISLKNYTELNKAKHKL